MSECEHARPGSFLSDSSDTQVSPRALCPAPQCCHSFDSEECKSSQDYTGLRLESESGRGSCFVDRQLTGSVEMGLVA